MAETAPERIITTRRTLGLAGITIHAMTLIAPGAFVWLLFPVQLSLAGGGSIWPGVLLALMTAFLTASAFSSLALRYPEAGLYSAYHFAQRVFSDMGASPLARPLKFLTGWSSHLFYWVYPGVMIALLTTLVDYLLRQFGSEPTIFGKLILAGAISAFVGFLALRGITGSMTSSILLNVLQISVVVVFCGSALAFRFINPLNLPQHAWTYQQASAILMPSDLKGLLVQASVAIFLVLGFEAVVSLGVTSTNPRGDLSRGVILALLIQGLVAYSFQYFAFSFALTSQAGFQPDHPSSAPLGDLAVLIGDRLLSGNGYTLMLVVAASVIIACLAAALTSMNTGVRTTFSMAMDAEMPEFLGLLHGKYATPYAAVIILSSVSVVIALVGTLGGQIMLAGLILAANLGAFCLYALVCTMVVVTTRNWRGRLLGGLGLFANLGLAAVIVWSAFFAGGVTSLAGQIALILALIWLVLSAAYYLVRRWRSG